MSLVDPAFESNVITLLRGIYDNIGSGLPYTAISGTFYQNTGDDSAELDELSNTSPYTLLLTGEGGGQITFTVEGDSDIRRTLIFLGPASQPYCIFTIQNDNNSPAVIVVSSTNLETGLLDSRGFGSDGNNPISFELRFYPEV